MVCIAKSGTHTDDLCGTCYQTKHTSDVVHLTPDNMAVNTVTTFTHSTYHRAKWFVLLRVALIPMICVVPAIKQNTHQM